MDERDEDGRPVLRSHGIAITDHGVRIRVTREGGGSRPEAQCLLEGTPDVTKLRHLFEGRLYVGMGPEDRVGLARTSASTLGLRDIR